MSEGKELKFKFVVDEQSAQRVNRVLDEMIKRAESLAKTLQGVGSGVAGGGIFGGGSVGGKAPSAQRTLGGAAATQTQKVSFASVITQNVDMLKKMGTEGTMTMKVMTDALVKGVDAQRSAIGGLEGELLKLLRMYKEVQKSGDAAFTGQVQGQIGEHTKKLGEARKELAEMQKAQQTAEAAMKPEEAPAKAGFFARLRGGLNSGGGVGAAEVSTAGLSKVPGIGALLGGVGGLAGGAMLAGTGFAAKLAVQAAMTAAGGAYNAPILGQKSRNEAAQDGTNSYARKLRAGDLSDVRAMTDIGNDSDKKREFNELGGQGKGFWNWTRRVGTGFSAAGKAYDRGEFSDAISNAFSGTDSIDAQNLLKGKKRDYISKTIEERGIQEDIMADATGNARGKMGTMRALGLGDGRKKSGAYRSNAERLLLQFNQFDPGEVQSAVQGVQGQGSRAAAYRGGMLNTVLQAGAAGINGAADIGGIMSRQGGSKGSDFIDLLRSQKQDVSVSSLLGNYVAQQQDRMNVGGFNGSGTLGALSFGTGGQDGAMIARQNIQGMEETQRLYSGARDPAQKAMNLVIAKQAAPDAGYYAQRYLSTGLDASRVNEVMGGDYELTAQERQLGVTKEMIEAQVKGMNKSTGLRAIGKGFRAGSNAGDFAKEMGAGGDIKDIAKKMFGGKTGKMNEANQNDAIETYATVLAAGDESMSWSKAMGTARDRLFGQGQRAKKGEMKGDVAGGSLESKIQKEEAERRKVELELKDASADTIEKEVAGTGAAYRKLVTNSANLAITANNITEIIKTFAKNLKEATGGGPTGSNVKVKTKD